jgi:chromate transporter
MHRTLGGIVAGGLFIVPGIVSILALSYIYAGWGRVPVIQALFFGLKAAVLAIVLEAVVRIGRRALKNQVMIALAAAAFIGIFFFSVPFPLIVFGAALIGFCGDLAGFTVFRVGGGHGSGKAAQEPTDSLLGEKLPEHAHPTVARSLRASAVWLALWLVPVNRGFGLAFEAPVLASVNFWALILSVAAAVAIFGFRLGMIPTLAGCCATGIVLYLVGAIGV